MGLSGGADPQACESGLIRVFMKRKSSARCPTCSSHELLTVTMNPHGDPISFTLCNACGWKRWGRGNDHLLLSSIRSLLGKRLPDSEVPKPGGARAAGRQEDGRGR